MEKFKKFIASIGPGIFLIGYNIGTGSIVAMSKAGANYGTSLLWILFLSCIFTYVLMVAYGKLTITTQQTALTNFRCFFPKYGIGNALSIYMIIALIIGELLALVGISGIICDLVGEGLLLFNITPPSRWVISLIMLALLSVLFFKGSYKLFERVLVLFVSLMLFSFIAVLLFVQPNWGEIAKGMVPSALPSNGFTLIAAMAGTTISAAVFIMRSVVVAEKGWKMEDIGTEKRDSAVSSFLMFLLSAVIMCVAAATLYAMGNSLTSTKDLIHLFEPIGGKWMTLVLVIGISAAGFSTIFPIVLIAPWLICDYTGKPRNNTSPLFKILGGAGLLLTLTHLFLTEAPPAVMIFSQAFQAFILPAVVIPVLILCNRKDVMKGHTNSRLENIGIGLTLLFSLATAWMAVAELF